MTTSNSNIESANKFLSRTLALLTHERDTDLSQTSLLASKCPPKLLESRGLAILNLSVANVSVGLGGKTLVELEKSIRGTPFPSHGFRNGDTCEILGNDSTKDKNATGQSAKGKGKEKDKDQQAGIQGVVYKVQEDRLVIALDGGKDSDEKDLDLPERSRVQKLANTVTYDRMDKAITRVQKLLSASPSLPPLLEVLLGLRQPSFSSPSSPSPSSWKDMTFLNTMLNDSQKDAVHFSLYQSEHIALIHGPPGTGKTSTLIEIIRQLLLSPFEKRVLVCAASNLAVDNILERLSNHLKPNEMSRVGHPARIMEKLERNTLDYQVGHSNAGEVVKDVKAEIEEWTKKLTSGKIRGKERKAGWAEVRELRKEYRKRESKVVQGVVKNSKVVLATCHGAGSKSLYDQSFDYLIIDEAAQALEPACWIPLLKLTYPSQLNNSPNPNPRLILAGDHLQLPPTIKSEKTDLPKDLKADKSTVPQTLELTMFDRLLGLYGDKVKRMLEVQYRMNEKIMVYPSRALYSSRLTAHESVASRLLTSLPTVSQDREDDGLLTEPVIFYDTAGAGMFERLEDSSSSDGKSRATVDGESKSNENEAEIVIKFVDELVQAHIPLSSISIITPYNAQVSLLSSLVREKYSAKLAAQGDNTEENSSAGGIEIGSVDGFQGREKDVIILSLVRSNEKKEVGFLSEKRRLNVAMTRAKRCLCVVGDSETVRNGGKFLKEWMDWLEENADVRVVQ